MSDPGTRTRRTAAETREHVLAVAHELFYWRGIRTTGVDTIAAEAGVAPTTLYRLFASKDDLVAAYVQRADSLYKEWFAAAAGPPDAPPRARILALFEALDEQIQPEICRGCPFLMALSEFPETDLPAHRHAVATKAWVRDQLAGLTSQLGVDDPDALADHLTLVFEGTYASTQALGATGPAGRARHVAQTLIDTATPAPPGTAGMQGIR
jgi:AcrR family transcriptional regulator